MKHNEAYTKPKNYTKIISWALAGLLTAAICFMLIWSTRNEKTIQTDIVFLGDSLFAENGESGYIADTLADYFGESVINGCLGGSGTTWAGIEYDYLSLYSLAGSIASGNFRNQTATHLDYPATEYFDSVTGNLARIDFSKVKLLILKYGLNDYHTGKAVYPTETTEDADSFIGSLRHSIRLIREAYPNLRIVLVTPCYAWYLEEETMCDTYDLGGGILEEYVDAMLAFAKEEEIEIIDQFHDFFPETSMESWSNYTVDGMHFNETGKKLAADSLIRYFQETDGK